MKSIVFEKKLENKPLKYKDLKFFILKPLKN